jgi:zinc protease
MLRSAVRVRCAACLLFLLAEPAFAQAAISGAPLAALSVSEPLGKPVKIASVEGITEYRLDNGLRVLLFPDPSKPTITVNITYLVGSRNENYGETGMAHLLEHMLFKGTPRHLDIPRDLTEHGARSNGQTSFDRTNYFETFQASDENLRWALDLEADRMIHSFIGEDTKIAAEKLKSEMTVVRNEYEAGENNPGSVLYKRLLAAAFDWHNYGKLPIGARCDIEHVNMEHLSAFFRTYYQPDNAVLLVAGRFDEDRALELVRDYFGPLPKPSRKLPVTYTQEPVQDGERQVTVRRAGDVQIALAGYHIPAGSDPDFAPIMVLARILGDTPTGRLHHALVDSGKATSAFAHPLQLREPSFLIFGCQTRAGANLEDCQTTLLRTLEDPATMTFSATEVARAKQQILSGVDMVLNDADRVGLALSDDIAMGDWRLFFLGRDRVKAVTGQDVERVAKAYLKASNRTLGLFIPTANPDRAAIPALKDVPAMVENYRGQAPVSQGEAFDTAPMAIESRTVRFAAANGLRMALVSKKTRGGSVHFRLALRMGDEASLQGKASVAELTADMLMRGTRAHNRVELFDLLDKLKAKLRIHGQAEVVVASGETTRENLPEVLKLVVEMLREPAFPAQEFEGLKREALASIDEDRTDPSALGEQAFTRHLSAYPKDHPRHIATLDEEAEAVRAATLEDLKAFHRAFYGASYGELALVGDFDVNAIRTQVEALLGDWRSPMPYVRMPRRYLDAEPIQQAIETPDKANAFFMAGMNLPLQTTDPDYPALVLGNFLLGGGFLNSRLATRLRQKDGISYSVGSGLTAAAREHAGQWWAYAIYAPQNAAKLEAGFREELARALRDGFTEEEIRSAKFGWLEEHRVSRAQDQELAALLGMNLEAGWTMAHTADLEAQVASLTGGQVVAALRKYIDPAKFSFVKAGDFAKTH